MKNNIKLVLINLNIMLLVGLLFIIPVSCNKDVNTELSPVDSSSFLAIDSLVATKTNLIAWEKSYITAYTRGENIKYLWSTNHGSMFGEDSSTVIYWACFSCLGTNTVECRIENEYGFITDTLIINVTEE